MLKIIFNPKTKTQEIVDQNSKRKIEVKHKDFKSTLALYLETLKELGEI